MDLKKKPEVDLEKKRGFYFQIGVAGALLITLAAFEWKSYDNSNYSLGDLQMEDIPEEIIPITKQEEKPPPPPPPPAPVINIVEDDVILDEEPEIMETEMDEDTEIQEVEEKEEEAVDEPEIFLIVEKMPRFPGGESALVKYLSQNIKYPPIARENGITGTVYLTFVIDQTGSVKDVKILRGIGGGCDEEAKRVVNAMPRWTAGKQRGKNVSVQYNLPVKFTLK